jgi:hypothetical protein
MTVVFQFHHRKIFARFMLLGKIKLCLFSLYATATFLIFMRVLCEVEASIPSS